MGVMEALVDMSFSADADEAPKPVVAHVLFVDVVGYSKLTTDQQSNTVHHLQEIVRHCPEYQAAEATGRLIRNPTGDGMALIFFDDVFAPARCASEIAIGVRTDAHFGLRMGIHSGPVYRMTDINGKESVAGGGINTAQRVMDCGDAGHILISDTHAQFLNEFDAWKEQLHDLGMAEVKHGFKLHLFSLYNDRIGNPARPAALPSASQPSPIGRETPMAGACAGQSVAIIYKRGATPDDVLLDFLEKDLRRRGCKVFIDRHLSVGLDWAKAIEQAIRNSDAVIPLLSPASVTSEMLALLLQIADESAQQNKGKPRILPIRLNWEGPLPDAVGGILNRYQYTLWRGPQDNLPVAEELAASLCAPEREPPSQICHSIEVPGGAIPLDSRFYIARPTDALFLAAIMRRDSIVLVEGARQMGKTSLLSRGLQQARQAGSKVVFSDFQKLNATALESLQSFYISLGDALADQLDLDVSAADDWRDRRGPNDNFERFLRREVLEKLPAELVWGLDEVDRLFTSPFGSEVFGLFRSWHNARALDPGSPWNRLTQVIAYATEAHLFITDLNQSPFNVGTRVRLGDFTPAQVRDLNERYEQPLKTQSEFEKFNALLGGQPYLVRRAFYEMASRKVSFATLSNKMAGDDGPFGDHLRRFLVLLTRDQELLQAVRELLDANRTPEPKLFHRLRAAGLLRGESPAEAAFRCEIYRTYLSKTLQ